MNLLLAERRQLYFRITVEVEAVISMRDGSEFRLNVDALCVETFLTGEDRLLRF